MIRAARLVLALTLIVPVLTAIGPATAEMPTAVRIVVEQSYEYRRPSNIIYEPIEGFELAISDAVEDMLFAAGIEPLLDSDAGEVDAEIRIVVRGRANGGTYLEPVRDFLYTGAQIAGDIIIEEPGQPRVSRSFLSDIQRPFHITFNLGYEDPANAPFDVALQQPGGFLRELAAALAQSWGVEIVVPSLYEANPALRYNVAGLLGDIGDKAVVPQLIEALDDDNTRVRWEAAWSLGRIGEASAIPDLIDSLEDSSEDVRWFASWSLRTITGEEYGPSPEVWSAWYEKHGAELGY